jgi:hypothetical protein
MPQSSSFSCAARNFPAGRSDPLRLAALRHPAERHPTGRHPTACHPTTCRPAARRPAVPHSTMGPPTTKSVPLPMTLGHMPAIALMHPMVGDPALVRMRALPVTADPLVAPTIPIPIATQPDISGGGRRTVFLDARWRRRNRDYGAYVIPVRGHSSDHASTEYYRQHGNCYQLACAKIGVRHMHSRRIEGGRFEWPQWRS